jgi:hypothetical protein
MADDDRLSHRIVCVPSAGGISPEPSFKIVFFSRPPSTRSIAAGSPTLRCTAIVLPRRWLLLRPQPASHLACAYDQRLFRLCAYSAQQGPLLAGSVSGSDK